MNRLELLRPWFLVTRYQTLVNRLPGSKLRNLTDPVIESDPVGAASTASECPGSTRMLLSSVHPMPIVFVPRLDLHRARLLACRTVLLLWAALMCPQTSVAQQAISFNRDIRPLLADRCYQCHGPDKNHRKGKLRLDRAEGPDGAYRVHDGSQAIKPGSMTESEIWYRLTTEDDGDMMPPADSQKQPLTAGERAIIGRWIREGAEYEDHWAFVRPTRPVPAAVKNKGWSELAIDRFVLRKLEASGLKPSVRADRRTLIRRVSFDLTGLPPSRAEIASFLADDSVDAYARLVDGMLAKPQYGEHMTKYWLDLVRFADTNGVHHDHYRDMSPYRDWVIRSFNDNLPYDQFITHQVAGDLCVDPTDDQLTASGFNRLHLIIDKGTALPEESFVRNVIDRVTAFGTAFMGLTVHCAVCHDHKYDPFKQREFFQLFAFFNNLDGAPETGKRSGADFPRGLQPPYISFPSTEQAAELEKIEPGLRAARRQVERLKQALEDIAEGAETKQLKADLKQSQKELKPLQQADNKIRVKVPAVMVMKERAEPRPAHILIRGAYDNPGERVERVTPAFLPPMKNVGGIPTRMDLAQWLVSRNHPLTGRVAVNRFWQQLFGTGLVKTSEDFGTQGEWPSHPELLDHLTVSFLESGWNVKALVKQIVMSAVYQQTSAATPKAYVEDPENRLLSRGSRFRMDSEMVRDQILATSGLLNSTMYGKSVKPPQPPGIWKAVSLPSSFPRTYAADSGDKIYRRSLYTFWKRGMPPPQMSILNAPTRESCTARRERTNTPLQALLMMNESEYLKAARQLAITTLDAIASPEQRLAIIYETITSKVPDAVESDALLQSVQQLESIYAGNTALAEQLCAGVKRTSGSTAELAAWTVLVSTIYNLDITKTRD